MKILVKRERVDQVMSGDPNVRPLVRTDVTDDDLNSEVELLKSRDLLAKVAVAAGLHDGEHASPHGKAALAGIVETLQENLKISPIRRTAFIKVAYRASEAATAARVLTELARLYPEKHLALHSPPGAYEFFTAQAEQFRQELSDAEARLKQFGRQEDVVSADVEKQNTLQRLGEFEAALQQAHGAIADATRRIAHLETEVTATPARQTTQVRTSENRELVRELRSRILGLEVKHAEMLRKFAPTYPPAIEVEQELSQARSALEQAEQNPLTEETTDQNPTHQWLDGELARVKSERAAALARARALGTSVALYRATARELDEKATMQQDLTRAMKSAEENYLLYRRKQEEARNLGCARSHTHRQRGGGRGPDASLNALRGQPTGVVDARCADRDGDRHRHGLPARLPQPVLPHTGGGRERARSPGAREPAGSSVTDHVQQLTAMYQDFYGVRERPFDLSSNPKYLLMTPKHQEALSNLAYGISSGNGITLLLGEAGTGKTTLLRKAVASQARSPFPHLPVRWAYLTNPRLSSSELLESLSHAFQIDPPFAGSKSIFLRALEQNLLHSHEQGILSVLVADEAQSLPDDLLEEVRLLANIETDTEKLLRVVLAGQPPLGDRLNEPGLHN
jgi:type II secretory pathway predicted ATPase ExeA/uncharacterized protein involved in exopolysaccharide biosynthesis